MVGESGKSDEALASEARAGDLACFEELVSRHETAIYRFALRWSRNETAAAEITQDTFVRAFEKLDQFDPARPFRPWLFGIARRKCCDHAEEKTAGTAEEAPEQVTDANPSAAFELADEARNLWNVARDALSADSFQALWLRYAEDLDVPEIARVLGKTRVHAKVILFRARRLLIKELEKQAQFECRLQPALPKPVLTQTSKLL